ncbi:aromatase/cyclase [Streptomyces sp. NPDC052396]|uniref:aromatase/cyclase n=1 Tax=Streptomyces sp. NPDC052396 TaxID=3365689 RepID=UPI0037D63C56
MNGQRAVRHGTDIARDADAVHALLADATAAVRMSPTVLHVAYTERNDSGDVIQRWVAEGGAVRTWQARRELDATARTVVFEHLGPKPPVTWMRGEWRVTPTGPDTCRVELGHSWQADGDDTAFAARMDQGIGMQLAALKRTAELHAELDACTVRQERTLLVSAPAAEVHAWLREAPAPPTRAFAYLPEHTTAWKQLAELPELHALLYGTVTLEPVGTGTRVSAVRTAVLDPAAVAGRGWGRDEVTRHVKQTCDAEGPALLDGLARAFAPAAAGDAAAASRTEGA